MTAGPRTVFRERARLDLSQAQVRGMESVGDRVHHTHIEALLEMRGVHGQIGAAAQDDLDEARGLGRLQASRASSR